MRDEGHESIEPEREQLVWEYARSLTFFLERGRDQIEKLADIANRRSGRVVGRLRDRAGDLLYRWNPAPWLERLYTGVGIASATAVTELEERLDDLETRIDIISRERARGELLLLQARIVELEQVLAGVTRQETRSAVVDLVDKLGSLEERIDAIRWPSNPRKQEPMVSEVQSTPAILR